MIPEILFTDLSPYLKDALGYIATAAAGGIIGNRADAWYMSLFYHQRKRILDWLSSWNPEINDIKTLIEDEKLRLLFSNAVADISNEINDKKLLFWPEITDSIIRCQDLIIDKKQYFISLFNRLDVFTLKYLATLYLDKEIDYFKVFNDSGAQPDSGSKKHVFYLGQLQCTTTGLTGMTTKDPIKFFLTDLGKEFIDFISDESKNKLKSLINE